MSRNADFRVVDVARALRAVNKDGGPWAVEIAPGGVIRIVPADRAAAVPRKRNAPSPVEHA